MNSLIIFLVFLPIINSFIISHTAYRILNATVLLDQKNLFDNQYYIYSARSAKTKIFAYDQNHACLVDYDSNGISVRFESLYTQSISSPNLIVPRHKHTFSIEACFQYESKTVLIYRYGQETNIMLGGNHKILLIKDEFQRIIHDQFTHQIYIHIDSTIYRINFDQIASLWHKNENSTRIMLEPIYQLREFTDYIIVNQSIYLIKEQAIYHDQLGKTTSPIKTNEKINAEKFNFLLFSPLKENADDLFNLSHFLIYFLLKFALIVLVLFFYRRKILDIYQKKMERRRKNNDFIDDEIYPSLSLSHAPNLK